MTEEQKTTQPGESLPFTMNELTAAYCLKLEKRYAFGYYPAPAETDVLSALYALMADEPVRHAAAVLAAAGETQLATQLKDAHAALERSRQAEATAQVLACPDGSGEERAEHWKRMHSVEQLEWESIAHRMIKLNYEGGSESLAAAAEAAQRAAREAAKPYRFGKGGSL